VPEIEKVERLLPVVLVGFGLTVQSGFNFVDPLCVYQFDLFQEAGGDHRAAY
jgi:hypothetical protein